MFWSIILLSMLLLRVDSQGFGVATNTSFAGEFWSTNRFRTVAYFASWSTYKNFTPQELPYQDLTHVLYAFAAINESTGEVYLSDIYADTEKLFPADRLNNTEKNLYGNLKQLYLLKKRNRNLKVFLSIGGAGSSANFTSSMSRSEGRLLFAQSSIKLVKNLGFDGLDIDWEFPENEAQAINYALLLKNVRGALDSYGQSLDPPHYFELSAAGPAGASIISNLNVTRLDPYLNFWNVMTYEYVGNWDALSGYTANLHYSSRNPSSTPLDTKNVIGTYQNDGIRKNKLIVGMPLFGRSFSNTAGPGRPYTHKSGSSSVYDVKHLPPPGAIEYWDPVAGSSFCYNHKTKEMIIYDNFGVANQKAQFIIKGGFGGAMWWESSSDRTGSNSLIRTVALSLGGYNQSTLAWSPNHLSYLDSVYANMRCGMPGE
ncbi:hypothetical protein V496_01052 [Pseudogymnoascus sp. VKM F-4515 (FW-2607)]|nr:hypothetical protein V496_01052 [Pseudogymnoascus sp. VKM F-4515 (FW-2607)]KFY95941.1 hypothetical protein V498_03019 [Pseudogymnoascus sp. VKM F-4517 (FW-2822)]